MRIAFTKCHGSGNDFPLVDARAIELSDGEWAAVARALADRAGPVGGDGLLLLTAGDANHAFGMRMFNPDGSEAETCLNGLRCVARAGLAATGGTRARVRLKASSAAVALDAPLGVGVVTVEETAGPVDLDVSAWLLGVGARLIDAPLPALGAGDYSALAIPNPHLVRFVDRVDDGELAAAGAIAEAAPDWLPTRANVSFVEVRARDLFVRTFERGVGLTNACGSAMAAASYVACMTGRLAFGARFTVFNAGGLVRARAEADGMVTLSANATFEWAGSAEVDLSAGRAAGLEVNARYDEDVAAWARVVKGLARP